jgi:hypothetical protein
MPDTKQKFTTYCNIPDAEGHPCGAAIAVTTGILAPEIGASPQDKTKSFVQAIVGHMQKKHPGHCQHALNTMEQFLAFTSVGFTQTEDPGALSFMAHFAEYLCKISTLPVSDDMIVELVTRMGITMEDPQRQKLIEAITYVRNFQLRKITPQSPAKSPELQPTSA